MTDQENQEKISSASSPQKSGKLFWVVILMIGIFSFWIYKLANNTINEGSLEDLVKRAESGELEAQIELGNMYLSGRSIVPKDYLKAAKWLRMAAEQAAAEKGDAEQRVAKARFNLGCLYADGQGVVQDYAEAAKWFRMAAEQGIAEAQYNLGVMYANGEGVPRDYQEAAKWFRMAADHGLAEAQEALRRLGK